jgi:membrane fusion protein, multidrug efflux system
MSKPDPSTPNSTPVEVVPAPKPKQSSMILRIVLPLIILAGIIYGVRTYLFSKSHEVTDDAAISGDVVAVMPEVNSKVTAILVKDNEAVKAGQLLITLDDSKYKVAVQQAQANLESALADAKSAGIDVNLTAATSSASQTQAQGGLAQAEAGIGSAQAQVAQVQAQLAGNLSQEQVAADEERNARIDESSAREALKRAKQQLISAKAALTSAQAAAQSSQATIRSALAQEELASKNLARYQSLAAQEAISAREVDTARAAEAAQRANVESAQQQLASAQAMVAQRNSDVLSAQSAIATAEATIRQTQVRISSSQSKTRASHALTLATAAQLDATRKSIGVAQGKQQQSSGVVQEAKNSNIRVELKRAAVEQAQARVDLARAAMASAKIDLARTKIYAPLAGLFSRRATQIGGIAMPSSALFSIAFTETPHVMANFKETQVPNMAVNMPVDIEVDGFSGKSFKGHIESIAAATGATFALLPPDNSTGNFVKVVQRVPVKIKLDEGQPNLNRLRIGMSATVTVKLN